LVWTVNIDGRPPITVDRETLARYRHDFLGMCGLVEVANRMSELFWLDVYVLEKLDVTPFTILNAVKEAEKVESGELPTGVKRATPFRRMPLKGLWHKHYFSAGFILKNLSNAYRIKSDKLIDDILERASQIDDPEQRVKDVGRLLVTEAIERRDADKELTGEWVIFLRRNAENYYLCCGGHKSGDQYLYDRIVDHCPQDFPDILSWINDCRHHLPPA
jgi:hypothetical protein